MIVQTIRWVIDGAISLRAACRIGAISDQSQGGHGLDAPCHTTIQNLILRVGLYLLQRTNLYREDWIWLMDHMINAGSAKCLVVLGITVEEYRKINGPLQHHNLKTLAILPVDSSNGETVCAQMSQMAQQYGLPKMTLTDQGSDLRKGVELFQEKHPKVVMGFDIVHLVCRILKGMFEKDTNWGVYRKKCCDCAHKVRQTKLAHLKPPNPKSKARYMNYDRDIRWATRLMWVLKRVRSGMLSEQQRQRLPVELVEDRFGWLDGFQESVSRWSEAVRIGQLICVLVRNEGYQLDTPQRIRSAFTNVQHQETRDLIEQVATDVTPLCSQVAHGSSLPGSTEVLESVIGKGKRLLHHNGNSITRQILSVGLSTATITTELVQEGLSSCRMKHLAAWTKATLGAGVHALR